MPPAIVGQRDGDRAYGVAVPAMDAGLGLGLLADLYAITAEKKWLESALLLAGKLISSYFDAELPRGAAGIDWCESQMGPSFLQHGLARIVYWLGTESIVPWMQTIRRAEAARWKSRFYPFVAPHEVVVDDRVCTP